MRGTDLIQLIQSLEGVRFLKPATNEEISRAQRMLRLRFAEDYTRYVAKFGAFSANGIEFTGVTPHKRLSVVTVTMQERELNPNIPDDMYVVENVGIDGLIILQDGTGAVYSVQPLRKPVKIHENLADYILEVTR